LGDTVSARPLFAVDCREFVAKLMGGPPLFGATEKSKILARDVSEGLCFEDYGAEPVPVVYVLGGSVGHWLLQHPSHQKRSPATAKPTEQTATKTTVS
jgi:hypothetical protein